MDKIETYLDGYANLYLDEDTRNEFSAKENEGNLALLFEGIPYKELSCRQTDAEFADANGFSLSRKIKIQFCPMKRNKKYKVIIDRALYDVGSFDPTPEATFLYLEFVREMENEE